MIEPKSRFRRYPDYLESEVEWLGEVPSHWRETKFGHIAEMVSGSTPSKENPEYWDGMIPWVSPKDMKVRTICGSIDHVSELAVHQSSLTLIVPPVVLIVVRGMILSHTFPVAFTAVPVTINQDMKALRLRSGLSHEYITYLFEGMSRLVLSLIEEAGHGTKRLRTDLWKGIRVWLPPIGEQAAISQFLDRKTAKLDALIAKKERLIELLQEKRVALITHAVTKGLDPDVPMKDSGVEWLGEIPAHWQTIRLKRLWKRCDYGISESLAGDGAIKVLTMAHVQDCRIALPEHGCVDDVSDELILEKGDLLFNRTNSRDLVAKVGMFDGRASDRVSFASYLVRIRMRDNLVPGYFNFVLNSAGVLSFARSIALLSINQANLNPSKYGQVPVPVPPKKEQEEIARAVEERSDSLELLMKKIQEAIDRLQEFRTALISAAVTGKIDVREEAA